MGSPGWHRGSEVTAPPSSSPIPVLSAAGVCRRLCASRRENLQGEGQTKPFFSGCSVFTPEGKNPHTLPPTSQPEQGITPCKDQRVAGRAETNGTGLDQSCFFPRVGWTAPCLHRASLEAPWRPGAPCDHYRGHAGCRFYPLKCDHPEASVGTISF